MPAFQFHIRWKEEIVCTGPDGQQLILEFGMGIPTAHLPTQDAWPKKAPTWAHELWPQLHDELKAFCAGHGYNFEVDERAMVF